jgi:hypothetical protein
VHHRHTQSATFPPHLDTISVALLFLFCLRCALSQLNSIHSPHISAPIFYSHSLRSPLSPSSSSCFIALSCLVVQNTDVSDSKVCHFILPPYPFHDSHGLSTVISGQNIQVPSERIPAGICTIINVDSRRRWRSAISILSSDKSVAWGNAVTL